MKLLKPVNESIRRSLAGFLFKLKASIKFNTPMDIHAKRILFSGV